MNKKLSLFIGNGEMSVNIEFGKQIYLTSRCYKRNERKT